MTLARLTGRRSAARIATLALLLALAGAATVGAGSAAAASEFGDLCTANEIEGPLTIFELSAPAGPLPVAAPTSGVITRWRSNVAPELAVLAVPVKLDLIRVDEAIGAATVVGESEANLRPGANSFETRLPVQAGDRLGITSASKLGFPFCRTEAGSVAQIGAYEGSATIGVTRGFHTVSAEARVPLTATIEPDVDGDGYGDETQDGCPQSADFHSACPRVEAIARAGAGAVTVRVATAAAMPISVGGVVALGKGRSARLSAPAQTVAAGQLASFTLKLPRSVRGALRGLASKRALTVTVTAAATDVAGGLSSAQTLVKLKGQKPKAKRKKGGR